MNNQNYSSDDFLEVEINGDEEEKYLFDKKNDANNNKSNDLTSELKKRYEKLSLELSHENKRNLEESFINKKNNKSKEIVHEEDLFGKEESRENKYDRGESLPEPKQEEKKEGVYLSYRKIALIKVLLKNTKENNDKLSALFKDFDDIKIKEDLLGSFEINDEGDGEIIEGVFDGENMIGPDGHQYAIPSNYASKSKLVEGDILKLTITPNNSFIYKQISPIERDRVKGYLKKRDDESFVVVSEDKKWKVLLASVTYFKGDVGDEVVLLVPEEGYSKWGAIENIIKKQ